MLHGMRELGGKGIATKLAHEGFWDGLYARYEAGSLY
jgi:hypothetical protein